MSIEDKPPISDKSIDLLKAVDEARKPTVTNEDMSGSWKAAVPKNSGSGEMLGACNTFENKASLMLVSNDPVIRPLNDALGGKTTMFESVSNGDTKHFGKIGQNIKIDLPGADNKHSFKIEQIGGDASFNIRATDTSDPKKTWSFFHTTFFGYSTGYEWRKD